jgi:hypothetical protein
MCPTKPPVPPGTTAVPDAAHPSRGASIAGATAQATTAATASPAAATPPVPHAAADGATPALSPAPAAATPAGVEANVAALADSLSSCADALHERIMHAIRQRQPGNATASPAGDLADGITQDSAQALFDHEVLLRQSANTLYVQAAVLATSDLDSVRQELTDVTASARDTLRHVAKVQALAALTADLVALAGALAAGKPARWPAAIRQVRDRVTALRQSGKA